MDNLQRGINITKAVSGDGWYSVESMLRPYMKFLSVASLVSANLPVMPLLVYTEWNGAVEVKVKKFINQYNLDRVQVRSQAINHSLGGKAFYNLSADQIHNASQELFGSGSAIVGIQAPGDIYRNDYSLNLDFNRSNFDFDRSGFRTHLEIVGPGFTATHLSKGGLMHERICIHTQNKNFERLYQISEKNYAKDVAALITKYGKDQLLERQSLLLENQVSYTPLPFERVKYVQKKLCNRANQRDLSAIAHELDDSTDPQPVFWDIRIPSQYDMGTIVSMKVGIKLERKGTLFAPIRLTA